MKSIILCCSMWLFILIFVVPPYLDIFGRFGLEPAGTSCTIEYWHGNFRNYHNYVIFLVIYAYMIPIYLMLFFFLRSVTKIQEEEITANWSLVFTDHQSSKIKVNWMFDFCVFLNLHLYYVCGFLFMVQIACWTPYAILVLWTIILPPETLNIYYTMLPSICCKVIICSFFRLLNRFFKLAPVLNALLVWWNISRVTSAYFYCLFYQFFL